MPTRSIVCLLVIFTACSPALTPADAGSGTGGGATGGGSPASGGGSSTGGGSAGGSGGSSGGSGGGFTTGGVTTALPPLPELTNVAGSVSADDVSITFDPVDSARDYRVYVLPTDDRISVAAGRVTITDATYRCAGQRQALIMLVDKDENSNAAGGSSWVNGTVEGFTRREADAVLGHVYLTAGEGRVPVYALGKSEIRSEGSPACGRPLFNATRQKVYTTDAAKRAQQLAAHARDDGIAFYVPAAASGATRQLFEGDFGDHDTLRWVDGPEGTMRGNGTPLFQVLTTAATGTVPLYRVHISPYCASAHDELAAGTARYQTARAQGDQPMPAVRWAGLTQDTVLVVEALDSVCPYQGHLSPTHLDGGLIDGILYPAFLTLDELRANDAHGEVFINGQSTSGGAPRAIARSFIHVAPKAPPAMDFFDAFNAPLDPFTPMPWASHWIDAHLVSSKYDLTTYANAIYAWGTLLGELWFTYGDDGADVNGKIRLTPLVSGRLASDTFLHATMQVDMLASDRRYPQLLISDRPAPVQETLTQGTTLIVQPKGMTQTALQLEVCNHRTWDVNNQCPLLPTTGSAFVPPAPLISELVGHDRLSKLDVYVSTQRIYLFLNDAPYACTALPAIGEDGQSYSLPTGAVTVTFGDVLYHSGVDFSIGGAELTLPNAYAYTRAKLQTVSRRHFDNIGFKSGVAAPSWDEGHWPCVSQ